MKLRKTLTLFAICLIYFLWVYFFVGIRSDHFALLFIVLGGYLTHAYSRKLVSAFFIFIIYWVIYDSMRVFPNYEFNTIYIEEPYLLEKELFGIELNDQLVTPNEYFLTNNSAFLDVLSGFFYINWVPIPLLFALYLFYKNKELLIQFLAAFLFINLLGFIVYYSYPAAPPWYFHEYGTQVIYNTPGNAAGLLRFDSFFGIDVFRSLYEKNANVFAAMPSLHSAYPIIVLFFGIKQKLRLGIIIFALFLMGIWFAAVYSFHHYIIDILAGTICALTGLFIFEKIIIKNKKVNNWVVSYSQKI